DEQVAGVGVPGDEPQRLALPGAADEDWRVRLADRLRHVERPREAVVPPLEAALIAGPHLLCDLERLLQPLEPLRDRREGQAERLRLTLEPRRADTEVRAPV